MNPTPIVIIGGGEHARVVAEAIRTLSELYELRGFFDSAPSAQTASRLGMTHLGDDSLITNYRGILAVLGVGQNRVTDVRETIVERLSPGLTGWAAVVHRAAWVSPTAVIEPGAVVMAGAIVQTGARIGAHSIVNTGAIIEHDVLLGAFASVGPGARIGGGSKICKSAMVGIGACVRDHVQIGARALIAMGAVVVQDVPEGSFVKGVPAR